MIRIVVALPAEARPLVSHFGLERVSRFDPLAIYQRPDLALIVSGPGSESAARAVEDLRCNLPVANRCAWLNLGVAGHRNMEIGTPCLASSVTRRPEDPAIALDPPDLSCQIGTVRTVDRVELEFTDESIYEMEAYGFCSALKPETDRALVQVLKIVSDNRETGAGAVSARAVQSLIESCLPLIDRLVYQQNRRSRQANVDRGLASSEELDSAG